MTELKTSEFDSTKAETYQPLAFVKQAVLVQAPEGSETTITVDWGNGPEPQKFIGSWYAIYVDGKVSYGSAQKEFEEMHSPVEGVENGFMKGTPIKAYQHHGEPVRIVTVLASGIVETRNVANNGDWIVQWLNGEVGVMRDEEFRKRYLVS